MDILINILKKDLLEERLSEFIEILKEEPGEYWRETHFLLALPDKYEISVVATTGDTIAGYIIASRKDNEPYIHKFMVRKDLRGRSLGTDMLCFFEKNILKKGFSSIYLAVREENESAIKFYKNNMFTASGTRKDTVDTSHLIIMGKKLKIQ